MGPNPRPATNLEADPRRWTVADLIDLDHYLDLDDQGLRQGQAARERLNERDRALYLGAIQGRLDAEPHTPPHRRGALRHWLSARRRAEDPLLRDLLPGSAFVRSQRLVTFGLAILGFFSGVALASVLLHYDGRQPVNVAWYLFILVFVQLTLALATALAWGLRRSRAVSGVIRDVSLLSHLVRPLFTKAAGYIQRHRLLHIPQDLREGAAKRRGLTEAHFALYGPAAYLPFLIAAQVFGIAFNLGVIAITLALEWFTDLAFGWGSALEVSSQVVHEIARLLAAPWSWLVGEGVGYPTLDQVAGSRISLKDPLASMQAADLRSWRWFLVLSVTTYGLLPRLLLLGASVLAQRRALAALPFTHGRTQALYARLVTPSLSGAEGLEQRGSEMPIPAPLAPITAPRSAPRRAPAQPQPVRPAPATTPAATPPPAEQAAPVATPAEPPRVAQSPRSEPGPLAEPLPIPAGPTLTMEPSTPEATPEHPREKTLVLREEASPPAIEPAPETVLAEEPAPPQGLAPREHHPEEIAADACILLIHVDVADILESADQVRLQTLLRGLSGWRVGASATYGGGSAMANQALQLVEGAHWAAPPARVALVQDGSQPPITELLRFLRALRAAAGEHAQVLITLVGDPAGDEPLSPLPDFERSDWQSKIDQLGDPYLRLETLVPPEPSEGETT
ncbi:MAG: DUF2868 domain-containing protein [Bdellovibrio bacteriovorus]